MRKIALLLALTLVLALPASAGAGPALSGRSEGTGKTERTERNGELHCLSADLCAAAAMPEPEQAASAGTLREVLPASGGSGYGAAVIDAASGRVLYAEHMDARLPMASTTKIMTALLALEAGCPDEPFQVGDEVLTEGTQVGLKPGDTVTLRTLAACMLLESGNDAANAAAARLGGGRIRGFVDRMNLRAEEMGLRDTAFRTPSGLDGDPHYTTARDLARLAAEALRNPDFAALCGQKTLTVSFGTPAREVTLYNHNRLLSEYEGCVGVKTGFTKKAGRCLVSAAERNGRLLVCATLNVYDDWNVHRALLDRCFAEYTRQEVSLPASVPVAGGGEAELAPCAFPVREGEPYSAEVWLRPFLYAPPEAGEAVGKVVVRFQRETLTLLIRAKE